MKLRRRNIRKHIDTVGLALYYKLWAGLLGVNTVFDYSGNGNTGTVNGTSIVPVYPGFDLAGADEYFDVCDPLRSTFQDSFTIALWVKLDNGQGGQMLIGSQVADNLIHLTLPVTGKILVRYTSNANSGNNAQTNDVIFAAGQTAWTHIACVCDSTVNGVGGKLIYVNGVLQTLDGVLDGSTLNAVFADFSNIGADVAVGALNNSGGYSAFAAGLIDEPMIFNVAKTASEILSLYMHTRQLYKV